MKVRMLSDISGTHDGQEWPGRGEVADLPDAVAADLIASGIAAKHADQPELEAATEDTRVARRGKPLTAAALSGEK